MKISTGKLVYLVGVWMLGLSAVVMPGLAQETVERAPTTSDESADSRAEANTYSLSGTVLNAVTGEPVRRAAVQVSGQNGSVALTDAGGHFVLEGLKEGNVFLVAVKPGFYDETTSRAVAARVDKDAPAVVLKLIPWGVISGHVTTKDEQPLEGFHIHLVAQQNQEGRLVYVDLPNQGVTNEEGEFRVTGLQAGTYYVVVDQNVQTTLGQRGVVNAREHIYTRVFYPGVSEMSAATPIDVAPGSEEETNFTLLSEPIYDVSGSLTAATGVTGLVFERKAGDDADFIQNVSVAEGKFQAKLPAGAYSVSGNTSDGVEMNTSGAGVVIRADDAELRVPLNAAATVPVHIEKEQGTTGSERRTLLQGQVAGVFLQMVSGASSRPVQWWRGQEKGIQNVHPGVYRLKVNTMGEWWVKSARSGSTDLLSEDLTVVEGEQPEPIEIALREDGATVSGTVSPASELAQITVLLMQPHGGGNFLRSVQATQGHFVIQGVPPGEYELLALEGGERLEYANPAAVDAYLSNAEQVSLRPHSNVQINLSVTVVGR